MQASYTVYFRVGKFFIAKDLVYKNIFIGVDSDRSYRVVYRTGTRGSLMRFFKYLFCRRLAIYPRCGMGNVKNEEPLPIYLFEWQKMPYGYRWF